MPRPPPDLSFAFTEHDTPALRRRIEGDLARIAQRAAGADPALVALVLTGAFSRGEGTARRDAPVNDYDLVAIRATPGGADVYETIAAQLTRELGIHVDLLPVLQRRLPFVGRKLFWLDLRLGGRVIAGDPRALDGLRAFPPGEISHAEIARLLGNRAAGMLLSIPARGEAPDPDQRDLQATKAVIAAMDAILLREGRYATTLRDRLAMTVDHPDHESFREAIAWKLSPGATLRAGWWEHARDVLLRAVEETQARAARDGIVEHALHALRARRLRPSPSQAVRRAAWDLLSLSTFPQGPADLPGASAIVRRLAAEHADQDWASLKRTFFQARARTLQ